MSFTLLAIDRDAHLLGAATASRSLAVGNSVPAIDPAVGVVASQAWTNRLLRHLVLDAMAGGQDAPAAVERVPQWDDRSALRQVAAIDVGGAIGATTGADATPWAGQRIGTDHVAIGNLLAGPEVLDAMSATFEADTSVPFARRLVAALAAGEAAGGDRRGRQSAALLVARIQPVRAFPPELAVDLRVDDAPAPLVELARLLDLREAELAAP